MKKNAYKPLRKHWSGPLLKVFGALWIVIVVLLYNGESRNARTTINMAQMSAQEALNEQWEYYQDNKAMGLGAEAQHILAQNLSGAALGQVSFMDGGMALLVRDGDGPVMASQTTWGYGHETGVNEGQRWYLYFDKGLDADSQIHLAEWLVAHRNGWYYSIYPADASKYENAPDQDSPDGTYARVTGIRRPGYAIDVQMIELVHPDGHIVGTIGTDLQGDDPITIELKHMQIASALFPSYSGDGRRVNINMERRMNNILIAQERARQALNYDGGAWYRSSSSDGTCMLLTGEVQTAPYILRTNCLTYLTLLLVTAIATMLMSAILSEKVTLPVEKLCRDVETGRCQTDGAITELNTLATAFNGAQEKLSQQLERERNFTRAAAHELKTPLAVLRAHAEALQEDIDPAKREEYFAVVLDEADRMAALTGNLLELSRLEGGAALRQEPVELSALVWEVFDRLALPMEQKGLSVTMETAETWVSGDSERLGEVVDNLATNVLRYCPDGKAVRVTLTREGDMACLRVYNEGEPIPEDDLPHLWEPFYRVDRSRSRQSGGTGLGLAIVRATVAAHGGACTAENVPGGVVFGVRLPLMAENK